MRCCSCLPSTCVPADPAHPVSRPGRALDTSGGSLKQRLMQGFSGRVTGRLLLCLVSATHVLVGEEREVSLHSSVNCITIQCLKPLPVIITEVNH